MTMTAVNQKHEETFSSLDEFIANLREHENEIGYLTHISVQGIRKDGYVFEMKQDWKAVNIQ